MARGCSGEEKAKGKIILHFRFVIELLAAGANDKSKM
jgi:hypothetical protein